MLQCLLLDVQANRMPCWAKLKEAKIEIGLKSNISFSKSVVQETSTTVWFCSHSALQYKWSVCYSLIMSITHRICINRDLEGRYLKTSHCAEWVCRVAYSLELLFAWHTRFMFCFLGIVRFVEPTEHVNSVTASSSQHLVHPIKSTWTSNSWNIFWKQSFSWAQRFSLLLGHLGFWFRHPDKYLNGSTELFLFGFSLCILWGLLSLLVAGSFTFSPAQAVPR